MADRARLVALQVQQEEARGVPQFVGEVAAQVEAVRRLLGRRQLGVGAGQGPPGRNGFLQSGRSACCVRMYMCSCFTGTSSSQCGHTLATGILLSCVSVA